MVEDRLEAERVDGGLFPVGGHDDDVETGGGEALVGGERVLGEVAGLGARDEQHQAGHDPPILPPRRRGRQWLVASATENGRVSRTLSA